MKTFIFLILLVLTSVVSAQETKKVYHDDCFYYSEIALATVLVRTDKQLNREELIEYIRIYLTDSQIPQVRQQELLAEMRAIWSSNIQFETDLQERFFMHCVEQSQNHLDK